MEDNKFIEFIKIFGQEPSLLLFPVILVFLTHWFSKKRKTDELLFNSRKKAYQEFISEYGIGFSENIHLKAEIQAIDIKRRILEVKKNIESDNLKKENSDKDLIEIKKEIIKVEDEFKNAEKEIIDSKYRSKITKMFSNCRLVAGPRLEGKLRDFYKIVTDNIKDPKKDTSKEKINLGFEIETLMRYDLKAISYFDLILITNYSEARKVYINSKMTTKRKIKNSFFYKKLKQIFRINIKIKLVD